MKNTFTSKKFIYFLFASLSISLFISSCSDDKAYNTTIVTADKLFEEQKYDEAKTYYVKALELKKEEKYPLEKINKIKEIILKKVDFKYANKISEADLLFKNSEYAKAKIAYAAASALKPNKKYPTSKISEIVENFEKSVVKKDVSSLPYQIIAGSYKIEQNATAFEKSLHADGKKISIIRSRNGNYLVSLNSFATLNEAYNYLITLEDEFDHTIWVYRK
jgi:tetratricopeptide (TPR) repeat protein